MAIRVECSSCYREYQVKDKFAGKMLPCKECGEKFRVSRRRRPAADEFEDDDDYATPRRRRSRQNTFNFVPLIIGGLVLAGFGIVVMLGAFKREAIDQGGSEKPAVIVRSLGELHVAEPGKPPNFPELGNPIRQFPDGTKLHFVDFFHVSQPHTGPGMWMKLRVYLPRGDHQPGSIPCVLVAPAGTNLLVGNDVDADNYHKETLPYAQAGMAVVFYSLDGAVPNLQQATDSEFIAGYNKFRAAEAGVVNGRNALDYVLAKVPQVDPSRIYCAGHSSAGTLSLLLAQHESRLRACIAYAPATDVEKRLEEVTSDINIRRLFPGLLDFVKQSSPKTHVANTKCPVFLFQSLDDNNVPASDPTYFADALRRAGKSVTYQHVESGGHYQPMIDEGIPRAIAWLQAEHGAIVPGFPRQEQSNASNPPTVASRPSKPGKVVMFRVLAYNGRGDATAVAQQALAGVNWAKVNEVKYNAQSKTLVIPMRGSSLNTGPAKASLQRAGFRIGFMRMVSGGR